MCVCEWHIVADAMHTNARLDTHTAAEIVFYIPAVDTPAVRLSREDFDAMRVAPNIGQPKLAK